MENLDLIIVLLITLVTSTITLLSGFGVGTVLTPVFAFFYDVRTAVFLVAIVHLANNLLKLGLFIRHVDREVLKRFGLVSLAGALIGSLLQGTIGGGSVRIILALFLVASGIMEFLPQRSSFKLPRRFDFAGGFASGLLGGLIGNQGAIRSAYLLNYSLSKEAFVATATAIAIVIDLTRIPVYLYQQASQFSEASTTLLIVTAVAFAGTLIGKQLLTKISLERFRMTVAGFLVVMGIALFF
jgi:uncharacterized membrane protein YfcA